MFMWLVSMIKLKQVNCDRCILKFIREKILCEDSKKGSHHWSLDKDLEVKRKSTRCSNCGVEVKPFDDFRNRCKRTTCGLSFW